MVVILTADEMMRIGLEMCGFDGRRQNKACRALNLRRFKAHFGSNPIVYAQIWEDLQTTMIPKARIDGKMCVESFLMAILFLKIYPTEEVLSGLFKICDTSVRKWVWYYVTKIQALKKEKVRQLTSKINRRRMSRVTLLLLTTIAFLETATRVMVDEGSSSLGRLVFF